MAATATDRRRYVNVRSNNLVETVNVSRGTVTIVTVRPDGYGPKRKVSADAFHPHYLDESNRPHAAGYVPVNTLPGDHPHAVTTEVSDMEMIDHLDDMSPDELADLILRQQQVIEDAKELLDAAKRVAKSREKDGGTRIYGDTAMVFTRPEKFDPATARKNLRPEDYHRICTMQPTAKLARAVFENEPDKLRLCMKQSDWTLTVRKATEKDYETAEKQLGARDDIEIFDLD